MQLLEVALKKERISSFFFFPAGQNVHMRNKVGSVILADDKL